MCDKPLLSCDEMPSKRVIFRSHAYGGRNGGASAIGVWIFGGSHTDMDHAVAPVMRQRNPSKKV